MPNRLIFVLGMLVVATSGCMYHSGYPYGYGPGPSVMPQQPWPSYPQGGYPQGGYPAPTYNPTPLNGDPYSPSGQPGSIQPTPMDGTAPNTYKNDGNNNAPTFNPLPGGTGVPNPSDDTSPQSSNPGLTPTKTSRVKNGELTTPFDESTRLPRNFTEDAVVQEEPEFHAPVIQASGVNDGELRQANRQDISSRTYGHAPRFEWLKGTVEFDESGQTWVIMYDDNPKSSDKLGGEVALGDHPALQNLQDGEIVQIEGSIDRNAKDWRGKPVYRIKKLQKIADR